MAQWLVEGLTATISGVITVFLVLIFIAFLISLLKYTDKLNYRKWFVDKKKTRVDKDLNRARPQPLTVDVVKEVEKEDLQLIAVITAAIAATLNTSTDELIVRSIRRVSSNRRR